MALRDDVRVGPVEPLSVCTSCGRPKGAAGCTTHGCIRRLDDRGARLGVSFRVVVRDDDGPPSAGDRAFARVLAVVLTLTAVGAAARVVAHALSAR